MPSVICACCGGLAPDCCDDGDGCSWDQNNAIFKRYLAFDVVVKGVAGSSFASCVGTILGTLTVAFHFVLPAETRFSDSACIISQEAIGLTSPFVTGTVTNTWTPATGTPYNIPLTGSTGDLVSINLKVAHGSSWAATGKWLVDVPFSINLFEDPTDNTSHKIWSISSQLFNLYGSELTGTCAGLTFGPTSFCHPDWTFQDDDGHVVYKGATYDHTEVTVTAYMELVVEGNDGCA